MTGSARREFARSSLLLCTAPLVAQEGEPLSSDRPDFTESTATVPALQRESGYTFARSGDTEEHTLGELLLRVPVARRVELRLGINSLAWTRTPDGNSSGIEDSSLGVKVNLAEGSASGLLRPSVAILAGATLPTGSVAFRERRLQPEATLALARDLSERVGFASNLGYAYVSEAGERFDQFSGSASLAYTLSERLGSYFETFGFVPGGEDGPNTTFLNGGVTYLVSPGLQLDARVGTGMGAAEADIFVGIGLSKRWCGEGSRSQREYGLCGTRSGGKRWAIQGYIPSLFSPAESRSSPAG